MKRIMKRCDALSLGLLRRLSVDGMDGKKRTAKRKRKRKAAYSKGELNKLIDGICHPLCESDKRFFLLDSFLHALVERDPPETVRKFVKYNLPEIMKQLEEKRQDQ
jgi:hypothetical protein